MKIIEQIDKYLNEKKEVLKVGDKVKEKKSGPFGKKEVGKVTKVIERMGTSLVVYNVKFPGDKQTYEYHNNEIEKA